MKGGRALATAPSDRGRVLATAPSDRGRAIVADISTLRPRALAFTRVNTRMLQSLEVRGTTSW